MLRLMLISLAAFVTVQGAHLGCFRDDGARVLVKATMRVDGGGQTIPKCISYCNAGGYSLAGVQYARECFCGGKEGGSDNVYRLGKATNCNMPCTGARNTMCGGSWAMNVYTTPAGFVLSMRVDDKANVYGDGTLKKTVAGWPITHNLIFGNVKVVTVVAENSGGGPAGILASTTRGFVSSPITVRCAGADSVALANNEYPGFTRADFDDSDWEHASSYGKRGVAPWGMRPGSEAINANAHWVWDQSFARFSICRIHVTSAQIAGTMSTIPVANLVKGKTCQQSSIGWNGDANRAVDGNDNPMWNGATCTHTQRQQGAWWSADMGAIKYIGTVVITNRKDCCSNRLANFRIGTTNVDPRTTAPALGNYRVCNTVTGPLRAGETRSIDCYSKGRYLVIQLIGNDYLTLCEVQVFAPAPGKAGEVTLQVDNNFKCFAGGFEIGSGSAWTTTYKLKVQDIKKTPTVACFMENTGGPEGMAFKTSTGVVSDKSIHCVSFPAGTNYNARFPGWRYGNLNEASNTASHGAYGRGPWGKRNNVITPASEWIWGKMGDRYSICLIPMQSVALGKPTFQPSQGWNGVPSRAVDGNRNPMWGGATCTHTQNQPQAWWMVDLGKLYQINSVMITNRKDCCSNRLANFQIGALTQKKTSLSINDYTPCYSQGGPMGAGQTKNFPCSATGSFVAVQLRGRNSLTLCEVEVFGAPVRAGTSLGCYRDDGARVLVKSTMQSTADNTIGKCVAHCKGLGYRLSGVQYAGECFCGGKLDGTDNFQRLGRANNCNMRCRGDNKQICGGSWAMNIYATGN